MWIDMWRGVPTRRMVLGLFLGNALADMYAQCGKCEVVNTSSICFPRNTNVGPVAEILGWVSLRPLLKLLQLYLLELCPMLESIQKCLWPKLCKLDQWTLYELCYQLIAFWKILKDDTTFDAANIDKGGTLDYEEFLAAIGHLNKLVKELIQWAWLLRLLMVLPRNSFVMEILT